MQNYTKNAGNSLSWKKRKEKKKKSSQGISKKKSVTVGDRQCGAHTNLLSCPERTKKTNIPAVSLPRGGNRDRHITFTTSGSLVAVFKSRKHHLIIIIRLKFYAMGSSICQCVLKKKDKKLRGFEEMI